MVLLTLTPTLSRTAGEGENRHGYRFCSSNFIRSAELIWEAHRQITSIATVLNNPRAVHRKVAVEGHTDARGGKEYNLRLARRRAETVARELIANGVNIERINIEEYGEQFPIAPNKNPDGTDRPEGRAQNRRVEVVILK
jgi:outer membrane protein OmpA-like peptidoglycan-associated protein